MFAIHGCIDGWSRKVLCLLVTRSNSYPDNIASYFLETVEKYGGSPVKVYRDFERKTVPWRQSRAVSDRNKDDVHFYCSSPRNERIEGFWFFLRSDGTTWWINTFFRKYIARLPQRLFVALLLRTIVQNDLDEFVESWESVWFPRNSIIS